MNILITGGLGHIGSYLIRNFPKKYNITVVDNLMTQRYCSLFNLDRKIKFIGTPEERIQEDYLRILRYFRFFTQYSKSEYDQSVIKSIKKHINGINKVSNERIFDELKKIFKLKNVYELFSNNYSKEIFLNPFSKELTFCSEK